MIPLRAYPDVHPVDGRLVYEYADTTASPDSIWQLRVGDVSGGTEEFIAVGLQPDWSPDGGSIAFRSPLDGNIHVLDLQARVERTLTTTGSCFFPRWSPDGLAIAFSQIPNGTTVTSANEGIWRVSVQPPGSVTRLRTGDARMSDWSPDGQSIAFSEAVGGPFFQVCTYDLSDSTRSVRTSVEANHWDPRWHPTEDLLICSRTTIQNGAPGDLYTLDLMTGDTRRLASNGSSPTWTMDGAAIVFAARDSITGVVDLYRSDRDGAGRTRLFPQSSSITAGER